VVSGKLMCGSGKVDAVSGKVDAMSGKVDARGSHHTSSSLSHSAYPAPLSRHVRCHIHITFTSLSNLPQIFTTFTPPHHQHFTKCSKRELLDPGMEEE